MSILALEEHECTVYETKGDWWADSILGKQQLPGIFEVTNKRFAFRGKTLLGTAKENGLEFACRTWLRWKSATSAMALSKSSLLD